MKRLKSHTFFITLIFLSNISFCQDVLDKKLLTIKNLLANEGYSETFYFDRYNCILFIDEKSVETEIKLHKITAKYRLSLIQNTTKSQHIVSISCVDNFEGSLHIPNLCISINGQTTLDGSINPLGGTSYIFNNKSAAINFLNTFNDYIDTSKKMGFCSEKKS